MSTFIKSNIEARFSSLIDGTHTASLFQTTNMSGQGIYLQPHQEHHGNSNDNNSIILIVFRGTGELRLVEQHMQPLHLQIMSGDILIIPKMSAFKILNTDQANLVISEFSIR